MLFDVLFPYFFSVAREAAQRGGEQPIPLANNLLVSSSSIVKRANFFFTVAPVFLDVLVPNLIFSMAREAAQRGRGGQR